MKKLLGALVAAPLFSIGMLALPAVTSGTVGAPAAHALPGQCFNTPWGGYCDDDVWEDGSFQHCEGAMGFSNCFRACHDPVSNGRVPTDYDRSTPC